MFNRLPIYLTSVTWPNARDFDGGDTSWAYVYMRC